MSQTTKPSRRSLRAVGIAGLAGAVTALASLAGASPASAAFVSQPCTGSGITGQGSSFQSNAQNSVFKRYFAGQVPFNGTGCSGTSPLPTIQYTGSSSGTGRAAMGDNSTGARTGDRFVGSDEPLSPGSKTRINAGSSATSGDDGQIHQIPVALGAIVPLVNFPDGCDVKSLPDINQSNKNATDFTDRAQFTKAQFEAIMYGGTDADQWGDAAIFPAIAAIPNNTAGANGTAKTDQQCRDQQITRVVRFDDSGSTYVLKDGLNKYNPSRGWTTFNGLNNNNWPNATQDNGEYCTSQGATSTVKSYVGSTGFNGTPLLVTACAGNGGNLVNKLLSTDGSVSYVDLSTALSNQLSITKTTTAASRDDDRYFTRLPNGSGDNAGAFVDPTVEVNGYQTGSPSGGANCGAFSFASQPSANQPPSSTLGDWSNVSATNATSGWGLCTLTYDLAFDDDAAAYPQANASDLAAEEKKARTVKDYLSGAVTQEAQNALPTYNYAALPASIRTIAAQGVGSIDWNKAGNAGSGGGGGTVVTPPTNSGSSGAPATGQPSVAAPSNRFSVPRVALSSKDGSATFSVLVPAAGTLKVESTATTASASASASAKKKKAKVKKIKLGTITRTVSKGGTVKITLKPTGSALKALKKAKSLKVSVKVTFTPKGGTARSSTKTITLKYKAPKKAKKAKKRS